MTAPTPPTPGAPATSPTPAPPPAPTPPAAPPAAPPPAATAPPAAPAAVPPWERDGQTFDAERAWNLVQSLRSEVNTLKAGRQQDGQAQNQLIDQMKRVLGLSPDTNDPAVLAERMEAAQDQAWKAGVELQMYKLANTLGADAGRLLDSMSFIQSLDELVDVDPGTPEFATALQAKVQAAIDANPHYRTGQAPGGAPRFAGGADGGPRSGTTVPQITEAQLARMSPEQIVAAQEAGQLNDLLGIK